MVTFQRERVRQVRDSGIEALFVEHWHELAHYPDIALRVNWDAYLAAEDHGSLRAYTARVDGELVGYVAFFVKANPHYSDSLQAAQDVLFLSPPHRKGRIGLKLVQFAEAQLATEGVQVCYHHVKLAHPTLGKLLEHLGYEAVETVYAKRLDHQRN